MMKAYQVQGAEQTITRRHTCHQLGICQCEGLNCIDTESDHDAGPIAQPYGDALYWAVVIFVSIWTCGVTGCIAGILYSYFGG